MINLNGIPKAGTHALVKAVELLGLPVVDGFAVMHHSPGAPTGIGSVFIYRHPKNALISKVRMERDQVVTPGFLITAMTGWHDEFMAYLSYLSDPLCLSVRLEDLIALESTHQLIAAHIGKPYILGAHANLPGMTYSWNAVPSNWQTDINWTAQVQAAWVAANGPAIETAFGYV